MENVTVLGGTGMLGSMLIDYLSKDFHIIATVRNDASNNTRIYSAKTMGFKNTEWFPLNVGDSMATIMSVVKPSKYIINAIGAIPQKIPSIREYDRINVIFPTILHEAARAFGSIVIQIGTDCVFSGSQTLGRYTETSLKDAYDDYGKSKIKGECAPVLRCSIIGMEPFGNYSLLKWLINQPKHTTVEGYATHWWNGITTLQFAKICRGIIANNYELAPVQHIVPKDTMSKAELLQTITKYFNRPDLRIDYNTRKVAINRCLGTVRPEMNQRLWAMAGYEKIPTIAEMVKELAAYYETSRVAPIL